MSKKQLTQSNNLQLNRSYDNGLLISIVSPCYNEEEAIELFYKELKAVLNGLEGFRHEIVLVDDGSTDHTLNKINNLAKSDPTIKAYSLSRNFGHQIALTAGLDTAAGDIVIMMDSDLQHPPHLIGEMVEKWKQGYDIVSTIRKQTDDASWFKKFTSKTFYKLINFLSDTHIPEGVADFTLLSRKASNVIRDMPEKHRFLRGMISWIGMPRTFIPYNADKRIAGRSKYTLFKMVSLAVEAALSFSTMPLRLATKTGILITFVGFTYLAWILLRFFIIGDLISDRGSLICVMLIIGGSQLFFIGLVGQYLARVFEEAKNRPIYVFKQSPEKV